jgi:proteasome lid subunit RPN8/RPN11
MSVGAAAVIAEDAVDEIKRHAAEAYPHECCGALLERDAEIVEAVPLSNTTSEEATRRFLVGPDEYRYAEKRARERGARLAGFYHSHPDHPARPSQTDLEQAWPNLTYVIVSVAAGTPADITCWRLREDRTAFDRGDLTWRTQS